ncbi:hypothetical protein FRC02_008401 [Tulasnella sp. 418]|nr:hypothetical protein FRC02_008401 [Tulasnella sp. 418]
MEPPEQFQELCWFKVVIPESWYEKIKPRLKDMVFGRHHYVSYFDVLASFGSTEFRCYIEWKDETGESQRRAITPIWNSVPLDSSRNSRNPPESRLLPQQDSYSIRNGKEPFHKAEANPKQVQHIPPSMPSSDSDLNTKLVISFDLGTTFSAASWVLLGDSQDPHIWDVSEFREDTPLKVPTVLYYDGTGKLRAVGSETLNKRNIADALEQGWTRVEWFKLLLHLAHDELSNAPKTEMPRNKKPIDIVADFFRYMARLALKHFRETMDAEGKIWKEVKDGVIYIFSHPNGWNTFQYSVLREAAILAKLVPDFDEGNNRIIFVSEAEAGLHWCVQRRLGIRNLEVNSNYIVVDAGGGAINVSSFRTVNTAPPRFEESSIPECHLQGSAFVTQAFRNFVQDKLNGSSFGNLDAVERMVKDFDHEVKHWFRDRQQDTFVRFGKSQDNDQGLDIEGGQLLVRGEEMAKLFEPACRAIVNSVKANVTPTSKTVRHLMLSIAL